MKKYLLTLLLIVIVAIASACSQTPRCPTANQSPSTLTPNEYNPAEFLPILCQTSEPFADFYEDEIEPLNVTVRWFHDSKLSDENPAQVSRSGNDCAININLLKKPPFERDAFIIAHELAVAVVCNNGFKPNWELACEGEDIKGMTTEGILFNMISSPLRDSILAENGFDADVKDYFYSQIRYLPTAPCEKPMDTLKMHMCAWDYVWLTLYWQDVLGNHDTSPDLDRWYKENRIDAYNEGHEILTMVNKIGYDTSDKVRVLFQWIIDEYDLECNIK